MHSSGGDLHLELPTPQSNQEGEGAQGGEEDNQVYYDFILDNIN